MVYQSFGSASSCHVSGGSRKLMMSPMVNISKKKKKKEDINDVIQRTLLFRFGHLQLWGRDWE